jgi:uncharacterized protein (DUF1330 family)
MKPKGYWIVRLDVHDEGRFGEYAAVVQRIMSENGARFLVIRNPGDRLFELEGSRAE